MESILADVSKVVVDTDSANNMLYLPLDKIMNDAARAPRNTGDQPGAAAAGAASGQSTEAANGRAAAGRTGKAAASGSSSLSVNPYSR